jgi:L-ascorbate metabolism protein UlaG (beta-lactamase superfamily)
MELKFNWIGGATFVLSIGNLNIACDPVLCPKGTVQDFFWFKSKRLEAPVCNAETFKDIDLWLITHNHEDHLDSIGLSKINTQSTVISNPNAAGILKKNEISDLNVLNWHSIQKLSKKGYEINIEAIPAIHGINPLSALFAGKVNGYYLTIAYKKEKVRIYITGDTVYKDKVINSLKGKEIDLLIPNMGAAKQGSWIMTLTLNAAMLRKMIAVLHPKHVIPVHFGTFEHYVEPVSEIQKLEDNRIEILNPVDHSSAIFLIQ